MNGWPKTNVGNDDQLLIWIEAFLIDRKAQNLSPGTLCFYRMKFNLFTQYCKQQAITRITQITPDVIREYMLWIAENHNPGGQHQCYRTLKTFLYWWENETEPENWKNPIRKIKAPRISIEPLTPVGPETIQELIKTCDRETFSGNRDYAIILALLDTGARASEFCSIDQEDYDMVSGSILIRQGKGRKPRTVFLGFQSRKAVRRYLKQRIDDDPALWITIGGKRLTYWGLHEIIQRRAKKGNVPCPELHSFRRAFALNMLRAGVDIYSLQHLMGHADLQVLHRYLAQTNEDLKVAHDKGCPVDKMLQDFGSVGKKRRKL